VGAARNAGLLAARILAAGDPTMLARVQQFQADLTKSAAARGDKVRALAAELG
jgi:5-(carboxyamino)imidazole ribonucleotide mutase